MDHVANFDILFNTVIDKALAREPSSNTIDNETAIIWLFPILNKSIKCNVEITELIIGTIKKAMIFNICIFVYFLNI